MADETKRSRAPEENPSFGPEEDGFRTDTFSRNDREGLPPRPDPGARRKATDDADSRDASPPAPDAGGVH